MNVFHDGLFWSFLLRIYHQFTASDWGRFSSTVCGMKRLGERAAFISTVTKLWCVAGYLNNHFPPNVLWPLVAAWWYFRPIIQSLYIEQKFILYQKDWILTSLSNFLFHTFLPIKILLLSRSFATRFSFCPIIKSS